MTKPPARRVSDEISPPAGVRHRVINVAPKLARLWLENHNHSNRPLMPKVVRRYARDMREGRWVFNGEALRFDGNGDLIDGQHRLAAIAESGTTQRLAIWEGLSADAQRVTDNGVTRTVRQQLIMDGVRNSTIVSSLSRQVILWYAGQITSSHYVPSNSEVLEFIDKNQAEVEYAANAIGTLTRNLPVSRPAAGAFAYRAFETHPAEQVESFLHKLAMGSDLDELDPILVLRNRLVRDRQNRTKTGVPTDLFYLVRTWRAHLSGERYAKLQLPTGPITPAHLDMPIAKEKP